MIRVKDSYRGEKCHQMSPKVTQTSTAGEAIPHSEDIHNILRESLDTEVHILLSFSNSFSNSSNRVSCFFVAFPYMLLFDRFIYSSYSCKYFPCSMQICLLPPVSLSLFNTSYVLIPSPFFSNILPFPIS